MVKIARLTLAATAMCAISSIHLVSAAQTPQGTKSVRQGQIRSSINHLLGWRVGIPSNAFRSLSFSEAAALADALGLSSIEGVSSQKVSPQTNKNLNFDLTSEDISVVKERLVELNLKMPAYRVESIPADEGSAHKLFAFAKEMGVETIIANTVPAELSAIDKLSVETGINVAIDSSSDPQALMKAIGNATPRIGVNANLAKWMENGVRPIEGLSIIKDRLMAVEVRDRNALGPNGRDVPLGTGVAGLEQFFLQIAKQEPPPQEEPGKCVNCSRPYGGTKPLFISLEVDPWQIITTREPQSGTSGNVFSDLWCSAENFEKVVRPAMGFRVEQDALLIPITPTDRIPSDVKAKIEAALPKKPLVTPKKPRKLLVIDVAPAGAYYHDTAAHANFAISKLSTSTGAFEAVFNNDLNNLKYPNILQYDAVFLNSGDGPVFSDPDVMNGLIRFVHEGGGLAGLHGASYASPDVPEFGELIGAQTGPHHVEKATLKIDDPNSPLTKQFSTSPLTADLGGKGFVYTDEFYHFLPSGPYSREKLHVLLSIDADKTDLSPWRVRPDKDYGLVWIKSYGHGRVFNCAMGHTPTLFETPALAQMMFAAIQFVLGDLPADTTPSAMLATK
ncbi:ThuA domain-containing protein [Edaphobacter modestus]|uniref:Trehalose utilization protein n=1 Tax=Edaphobacter modestus TaxID=388466 RepID=A0A4Q7XZA2_9BACT|nr:ThuA domain-containing protein [Edaphobacter modestus]RZU29720.1 trehalose utilization protein [Edaphobacter modestus]